jgi:TRAP-type uncharacterized transport system fused permease subunit
MALFTASAIAGSNWMETGWKGMRLTLSGYLVPFGFIFIPTLLLRGSATDAALHVGTVAIGVIFLSAAVMGYLRAPLHWLERVALVAGAALLFHPGVLQSVVGFGICAAVAARHVLRSREAVTSPAPARGAGKLTPGS